MHPDHDQQTALTFFSSDGRWILANCPFTGGVQVWDAQTGEQIRTLRLAKGYEGRVSSPVPSPDGRTLYVPISRIRRTPTRQEGKADYHVEVDGEITVWDVASGRQLSSLKQTPSHAIGTVRPSPDGAILLSHDSKGADAGVGVQHMLTQWDLRTGKPQQLLDGWWNVRFAPDGKTFVASFFGILENRGKIVLWDVAAGKERLVFAETKKGLLYASVFSPDGRYLAGGKDPRGTQDPPEEKLWDVASGKEVGNFAAPKGTTPFRRAGFSTTAFGAQAFAPDSRWLASYLHTGRVYLYDVAERKLAWSQDVKNGWLRELAFSPDGRWLAVAAQDSPEDLQPREEVSPFDLPQPRIFLFDMKAGGAPEEIVAPHGKIGRLAFSPDSKTIALGGTGCVWLFGVSGRVTRK